MRGRVACWAERGLPRERVLEERCSLRCVGVCRSDVMFGGPDKREKDERGV